MPGRLERTLHVHARVLMGCSSSEQLLRGRVLQADGTASTPGSPHAPAGCRPRHQRGCVARGAGPVAVPPARCTRAEGGYGLHAPVGSDHDRPRSHRGSRGRPRCGPASTPAPGFDIRCTSVEGIDRARGRVPPRNRRPSLLALRSCFGRSLGATGTGVGADVDAPSGESGCQPGVLALPPDG
jgi:hypothetical protein